MERAIFQAPEELLDRVRRHAEQRGVSFAQVVRDALERELNGAGPRPMPHHSMFHSGGRWPSAREVT
ncbi:MAG: ribbon-helix-helix domain-containing protein, partial [Actinomycetota bacterium]|nr:ribbon-helix-helix domain-containing protein [Actinomycetota bacterium]